MGKILFYGVFCLWVVSCKREKGQEIEVVVADTFFSVDSLPKPAPINDRAMAVINDWQEFKNLETTFESLYRVDNREDLTLVIEDLIEKQKMLEASRYPETFNKPQIKSRQKVFKTYVLKTKGNLAYRVGVKESTLEMVTAYNAFRNQFSVLVNSALDTNLILDQ
ncbi:MAG TPA: hypothetical protein VLZ54_10235 [Arenibacter sp.]|nr:hypothetical protein [Arenibacter sp.]